MTVLLLAFAMAIFAGGVSLSAFFSGSETAFYRVSMARVAAAAEDGDERASRILRFVRRPAAFVATVLVGNNVANYLVTVASGLALAAVLPERSDAVEIALTIAISPIVFLFGELVPKNVNYLQPLRSLRAKVRLFGVFDLLFRPLSYPVVQLTRLLSDEGDQSLPLALSRHQLGELIERGETEGVLTEPQVRLGNALLRSGSQPIADHVLTSDRMILDADVSRAEAREYAHRFGLGWVVLRESDEPARWVGAVSIGDLLAGEPERNPRDLARPMPTLRPTTTRLVAGRLIREADSGYAVVVDDDRYVGLVSLHNVVSPLFRLDRPAGAGVANESAGRLPS